MTLKEYKEYERRVEIFFKKNNLTSLNPKRDLNGDPSVYFDWRPCECCRTHLGGDRQVCKGYDSQSKEVVQFEGICNDCVYYAEYGQLDDMTMMDIEDYE